MRVPRRSPRHRTPGQPRLKIAGAASVAAALALVVTGAIVATVDAGASVSSGPRTPGRAARPPASPRLTAAPTSPAVTAASASQASRASSAARPAGTAAPTVVPDRSGTSGKKGVSTWEFSSVAPAIKDVGASWYYNWSASNDSMPADAEFVPMIWGAADVTDARLAKAKSEGTTLLGFNEPDMDGQAKMSVDDALRLWPRLEATGMRLGSPAVAYGGDTPGGWLDRFMTGAKERNLRVDFITLHWYGSDFGDAAVGHFTGYLQAVYNRYHKPIWVTEFGLINFGGSPKYPSTSQITAFITNSTKKLEAASYIERYAWFGLPAVGDSVDFGLYRDGSTPTPAGVAYRAAGGA